MEIIAEDVSPEQEVVLRETAEAYPTITGLPDDLAANHDYYLYGLSKQQPRRGRWIPADQPTPELGDSEAAVATEFLRRLASETSNLPSDLAMNHDHYLHGRPRE